MNRRRFRSHPLRFVALLAAALVLVTGCDDREAAHGDQGEHAEAAQLWTCGMHPNVVQDEPGQCPICGMDLTPLVAPGGAPAAQPRTPAANSTTGERKIKHWVAPMDPTYISDAPGKSPMGMDLVPVYEDELPAQAGQTVVIDPVVVQNMGVRIERVERQTLFKHLRTIGQIETAEDLVSVVNLRFSGWVEKIHADTTGEPISEGETLLEIYSPELVAAQDEYLLALRAQGSKSSLTRSARRKLDLFGLDPREVAAIERAGRSLRAVPIRAPRSGYVLDKNVVEGARVMAGEDLYRIGDLSTVWVKAEVYEHDAPWVEAGQRARMELSHQRGVEIGGTVAYVYPTLNERSRTLTVRLEFPNPGLRFKPGMFATVYIEFRRIDDAVVVPTEAVIHSGTRELVFVAVGEGRFDAREITTGLVGDRRLTEVVSGLEPGERVVTSGQFLIDSESQLQEAISKMLARRSGGAAEDGSGMASNEIWACPMHPDQLSHEPGRCAVCGMDLERRSATPEEMARLHARAPGSGERERRRAPGASSGPEGQEERAIPPEHASPGVQSVPEEDATGDGQIPQETPR